jgi:exodeoxyribonuclease VII large subunit
VKVEATFHGDRKVFSVSAFNEGVGIYLRRLPTLWVEGEVIELRRNDAWSFVFFTLRDPASGACLSATIQRRRFDSLDLALADGERVLVEGKAELYAARGTLNFRAVTIERIGIGDHLAAIERLKYALASEGLFAAERKRALPAFPRAVGVVTGADAAARGDVVSGLRARYPAAHIVIAETRVQGSGAPRAIATAIARVAAHPAVDVVIVARGGGSFEDLLPFSDEVVVRAFAGCPVPIVSAVGHEQDTPLCDLAADVRSATPTAAVRLVVPDLTALHASLGRQRALLDSAVRRVLARERERLQQGRDRLVSAPVVLLERRRTSLDHAAARLQALSPRATLTRGYAIVRSGGVALRDAHAASRGERVEIELASGGLTATVEKVRT